MSMTFNTTIIPDMGFIDKNDSAGTTGQVLKSDGSGQLVWADESGSYILPTASSSTKGGVKIGSNLSMNGEVLNADDVVYVGNDTPPSDESISIWVDTSQDEIPITTSAGGILYNNTSSGLSANNVQDAIDELNEQKLRWKQLRVESNSSKSFYLTAGGRYVLYTLGGKAAVKGEYLIYVTTAGSVQITAVKEASNITISSLPVGIGISIASTSSVVTFCEFLLFEGTVSESN